jgi:uncharacterized protein (TIGR02246 family)
MDDEKRVEGQVRAFQEAFNARDASALARCFTDDATFVNIIAVRMRGRAGIEAGHAAHFAGVLAKSRIDFTEVDVKPLTEGVMLCHAAWTRAALESPDGATLPPGNGIITFVAAKDGADWRFAAGQNTQAGALPGRPR